MKPLIAKVLAVVPAIMLLTGTLKAQEPDTALISRIMAKYGKENAVITNYQQKLIIRFEDDHLTATSKIKSERLLTGDFASSQDNHDFVYTGVFDQLTQIDAVAYMPQKKGGYRKNTSYTLLRSGTGGYAITDGSYVGASFTGLTKGSFMRLTATKEHPELTALPHFWAIGNYPIVHGEFEVTVPKYVDMRFVLKGENTGIIKQTKTEQNGNYVYKFTVDDLPAGKLFDRVPSIQYYAPHVLCYIASYKLPGQAKDSLLLSDPEHLHKSQYRFVNNLNVKQDTGLKRLATEITKGDKTDMEKARHLYEWVQQNMHYIAFEIGLGGWIPREADTVCKKKYGDCKDMSSLLMQMGRMVGLKTYWTWIGTTDIPYTMEETPVPNTSNHMICALQVDGDWLFMDGTHSNLPFGANRDDIQGKEAMIALDRDHYKIVTIPVMPAERNMQNRYTHLTFSTNEDKDVDGTFKDDYVGYKAWNTALSLSYITKEKNEREKLIARLSARGNENFVLENYDLKTEEKGNKDMSISGKFTMGSYATKIGKDYIVNLNVSRNFENDYIDTVERKVPWYFDFKNKVKDVVVLDIPEGYKVKYLPKNAKGGYNDMWNYSISYKTDGKTITLSREYSLNTLNISRQHFAGHNKAIKELQKNYKESVILTAKK